MDTPDYTVCQKDPQIRAVVAEFLSDLRKNASENTQRAYGPEAAGVARLVRREEVAGRACGLATVARKLAGRPAAAWGPRRRREAPAVHEGGGPFASPQDG